MTSDEQLMQAYLDGDTSAFRELFERYAPRLERVMRRKIDREQKVEELVQQTFLQLHRARNDYNPEAKLRPWIYTIALNLRRDYKRKAFQYRESSLEALTSTPDTEKPGQKHFVDRQQLAKALDTLSEGQRRVVELHWFEGLQYSEIAQSLEISESAAKVRAHRAYKQMKQYLQKN